MLIRFQRRLPNNLTLCNPNYGGEGEGQTEKQGLSFPPWTQICQPEGGGGGGGGFGACWLGLPNTSDMNLALLAKLSWRFIANPEGLLAKIFNAKYEKSHGW